MDIKKYALMLPILLIGLDTSMACTRVLRVDQDNAVMVGRTMDWKDDMQTTLVVYPRGISHSGGKDTNPVKWTSRYGSLVATAYDRISSDGFNEEGLGAHILWLNGANYGARDVKLPGLSVALWLQYYLDNFKTVAEAVQFSESGQFQITSLYHPVAKRWATLHLVLDDAGGDSAILEYVNGKLRIYHDKKMIAVTNDPGYDEQIMNLSTYTSFGGNKPLPGTSHSSDRFVRAAYYTNTLPKAKSVKEELTEVLSILNNAAQPYTSPSEANPYESKTIWRTVSDLTNRTYYYQSTASQNLLMVNLDQFHLKAGSPIMQLELVRHPEYVGDMTAKFEPLVTEATA